MKTINRYCKIKDGTPHQKAKGKIASAVTDGLYAFLRQEEYQFVTVTHHEPLKVSPQAAVLNIRLYCHNNGETAAQLGLPLLREGKQFKQSQEGFTLSRGFVLAYLSMNAAFWPPDKPLVSS